MVCLALELVGPWVELGFSVGMEAFDELLLLNVPEFRSSLMFFDKGGKNIQWIKDNLFNK